MMHAQGSSMNGKATTEMAFREHSSLTKELHRFDG